MKRRVVWLVALMAIVSAGRWAYYARSGSPPAPTIATAAVTRGDIIETVDATRTLQAAEKTAGAVANLLHRHGRDGSPLR